MIIVNYITTDRSSYARLSYSQKCVLLFLLQLYNSLGIETNAQLCTFFNYAFEDINVSKEEAMEVQCKQPGWGPQPHIKV